MNVECELGVGSARLITRSDDGYFAASSSVRMFCRIALGSGRFTRRLFLEHREVQPEVLGLGVFHERPRVAEPPTVMAFEQSSHHRSA